MNWLQTHRKLIVILVVVIILGIIGGLILSGRAVPPRGMKQEIKDNQTHLSFCGVQEFNLSLAKNMTIIHLTDTELNAFPELRKVLEDAESHPSEVVNMPRAIKNFDAEMSQYYRFANVVCMNKTFAECFPHPPLYEYHGRYYSLFCDDLSWHRTYAPPSEPTT